MWQVGGFDDLAEGRLQELLVSVAPTRRVERSRVKWFLSHLKPEASKD
jgi:hypothetical protein